VAAHVHGVVPPSLLGIGERERPGSWRALGQRKELLGDELALAIGDAPVRVGAVFSHPRLGRVLGIRLRAEDGHRLECDSAVVGGDHASVPAAGGAGCDLEGRHAGSLPRTAAAAAEPDLYGVLNVREKRVERHPSDVNPQGVIVEIDGLRLEPQLEGAASW
jgi:hypothetical protein